MTVRVPQTYYIRSDYALALASIGAVSALCTVADKEKIDKLTCAQRNMDDSSRYGFLIFLKHS
jgi:hypothetical protein